MREKVAYNFKLVNYAFRTTYVLSVLYCSFTVLRLMEQY